MGERKRTEEDKKVIERVAGLMEGQGPGGEGQIWGGLDDKTRDLIEALFAERMCQFNMELDKAAPERNKKEYAQFLGWKERMEAKCPGIGADLEEFMDWVTLCGGEESRDAYIYGMTDGIRLMKLIDSI